MRFLLDTHSLIWFVQGDSRFSAKAASIVGESTNETYISAVSLFEIAIKLSLKKLELNLPLAAWIDMIERNGVKKIAIKDSHLLEYTRLPLLENHRDPFDRLLIATAKAEGIGIITADKKFSLYQDEISIIW